MKNILTLLIVFGCVSLGFTQINPGFFEMRLIDGSACNRVMVQMRAVSSAIPVNTNPDDCQGLPFNGNTINYDLTFTIYWTEASITNAQDVLSLSCVNGGMGYDVRDVGGSGLIDLGGGVVGKGFSNGNFTPLDAPVTWVLDDWNDITEITLVNFNCENPASSVVSISAFGNFSPDEDPNVAWNIPDEDGITDYTPSVEMAMPLDLLSFDAEKHGDRSAIVTWATTNEINSSHFVIERSADRYVWVEAGKVKASGEEGKINNYEFRDNNVYDGRSQNVRYYYRLLIVDNDGRTARSNIDVVQFASQGIGGASVYVFPNPSTSGVNIELNYGNSDVRPEDLLIYNELGQLVYSQVVPDNSTLEYIDFSKTNIGSGAYSLQILNDAGGVIATEKIIVQR